MHPVWSEWITGILAGLGVLLLFGLAVFVHELGHFLAARRLGLVVDVFSIGFGPAIWKKRIGAIEYRISWVPFGGYVALPQMDPSGAEAIQGEHGPGNEDADKPARVLPDVPAWKRVVVAFCGPLGNILLAVLLAWVVYFAPAGSFGGTDMTVGGVATNSPAYDAGMRPGDRIVAVGGAVVATWNEFRNECHLSGDADTGVAVTVQREGTEHVYQIPVARDRETRVVRVEGIVPASIPVVAVVSNGTPAAAAGIQPQDMVRTFNGEPVLNEQDLTDRIGSNGDKPVVLGLERKGRGLTVTVTPWHDDVLGRYRIGVVFANAMVDAWPWMQYRRPLAQLTYDARSIIRILKALLAPRARGEAGRAAGGLGGPLIIMVTLWYQVLAGWVEPLAFLRFLCVNLALINLLPLPVLDGGHLFFALWETVTRRKLKPRVVNLLANVFAVLLILLMALLVFRDALLLRVVFGWARRSDAPAVSNHVEQAVAPALPLVTPAATNVPATMP